MPGAHLRKLREQRSRGPLALSRIRPEWTAIPSISVATVRQSLKRPLTA